MPQRSADVVAQIVNGIADDPEVAASFSGAEWRAVAAWFEAGKLTDAEGLAEALCHEEPELTDETAVASGD